MILVSGRTTTSSIENYFIDAFVKELGQKVKVVATNGLFDGVSTTYKIIRRLFPARNIWISRYNNELIRALQLLQAGDVFLIFKGMEVYPETIQSAKNKGLFVVNYNPDHPFIFSGRGSGNSNVSDSIALFDIYITYDIGAQQMLEKAGITAAIVPFGFDNQTWMDEELSNEEEILRCCFVGNCDDDRLKFLQDFSTYHRIDIYGGGWPPNAFNTNVRLFPPVHGSAFYEVLRKYRVQINLMRPHNKDGHNMRTFDITGCGGIGLMPETHDHLAFFKPYREIFLFNDIEHAADIAQDILTTTFEKAQKIRAAARQRAVQLGGDYKDRGKLMLDIINKANKKKEQT